MDGKLAELRRKLGAAVDELPALVEDAKAFDAKEAEIAALEGQISRAEAAQKRAAALARPPGAPLLDDADAVWSPPSFDAVDDTLVDGFFVPLAMA